MKVGDHDFKIGAGEVIELKEGESIQMVVPASMGRTTVHMSVTNGLLEITGGSSIIDSINGPGMIEKVRGEKSE